MSEETLGERVKRLRVQRGLTQERLAQLASQDAGHSVSTPWLSRLESGFIPQPGAERIRQIAAALGVSADLLFEGDQPSPDDYDLSPESLDLLRQAKAKGLEREGIIMFRTWLRTRDEVEREAAERAAEKEHSNNQAG